MIYLLLLTLLVLLISAFFINKKDILSPWFISIGMFCISSFTALLNADRWGFELSPQCYAVIIGALIVFGIGEQTIQKLLAKYSLISDLQKAGEQKRYIRTIPMWFTFLLTVALTAGAYIIFRRVYALSIDAGNTLGIKAMLQYARRILITPGNHMGRFCNHISIFAKAVAYIYIFLLLEKIFHKKCSLKHLIYILPIVVYVIICILGTGRTFAIEIISYILIISFILFAKGRKWGGKELLFIAIVSLACLAGYFILFIVLGSMKGTDYSGRALESISSYVGSSIPDLNGFLNSTLEESAIIGEETLYGLHSIFRKLGFEIPETVRHLEFGLITNVYSALRRYIHDYGILGMLILQTYIGMFYSIFYNLVKCNTGNYFLLIIYGWLAYPLVMQAIDDILLSSYIGTTTVYFLIYLGILYACLVKTEDMGA